MKQINSSIEQVIFIIGNQTLYICDKGIIDITGDNRFTFMVNMRVHILI